MRVHMRVHSMRLHIYTCALGTRTESVAGACLACRPELAELCLPACPFNQRATYSPSALETDSSMPADLEAGSGRFDQNLGA